jgi:hypothetical protein
MSGFPTSGLVTVGGVEYAWEIKHLWGASSMYDNYRGLGVTVALDSEQKTKELIIEFSIDEFRWERRPTKAQLILRITQCIVEAIGAGWVPAKRGKAFVYSPPACIV